MPSRTTRVLGPARSHDRILVLSPVDHEGCPSRTTAPLRARSTGSAVIVHKGKRSCDRAIVLVSPFGGEHDRTIARSHDRTIARSSPCVAHGSWIRGSVDHREPTPGTYAPVLLEPGSSPPSRKDRGERIYLVHGLLRNKAPSATPRHDPVHPGSCSFGPTAGTRSEGESPRAALAFPGARASHPEHHPTPPSPAPLVPGQVPNALRSERNRPSPQALLTRHSDIPPQQRPHSHDHPVRRLLVLGHRGRVAAPHTAFRAPGAVPHPCATTPANLGERGGDVGGWPGIQQTPQPRCPLARRTPPRATSAAWRGA